MSPNSAELLGEPISCKWITTVDDHADHPGQTLLTRNHDVVRTWARAREAEPATGVGKMDVRDGGTALRFEFPGMGRFEPMSWDDWFAEFERYAMTFVFQERTAEGDVSHRYRLVIRDTLISLGICPEPGLQ